MTVLRWAAIAVTALFVLMNLGAALDADLDAAYRVAAAVLGVAGLLAAVGFGASRLWGRGAVIVVGALNVVLAFAGLLADQDGAVIGIVVGGLAAVLGVLSRDGARVPAT